MKNSNYIQIISVIFIALSFVQCKKTNWNENFRDKNKDPFGTYILFNETENLLDNKVHYLEENIYDYLLDYQDYTSNYICIKSSTSQLSKDGENRLLSFVSEGNTVFLALNFFSKHLQDTLGFEALNLSKNAYSPYTLKQLKGTLNLENKNFKKTTFDYDRNIRKNYFSEYNTATTQVLGTQKINDTLQANFIKIYHKKGAFYLHTQPIAFTNYFLLNNNKDYAANVFSYLKNQETLWDPQIRWQSNQPKPKRYILDYFLKNPSLKWFLYVSFFSLLLFMVFNTRRKQRPIPIIEKPKNTTVEFAQTISNLYFLEKDHKNVADKKTMYFLEKVRQNYLIDTSNLNTKFKERLALKSNNKIETTNLLVNTIISLNGRDTCTEQELFRLNTMIDKF